MWHFPPVAAELAVDFGSIDNHILDRRATLEHDCAPIVRRYAEALDLTHGIPSQRAQDALERQLFLGAWRTYRYGYDTVTRELKALRQARDETPTLIAAEAIPGHPQASTRFVRSLSRHAAMSIHDALMRYFAAVENDDGRSALLEGKARKLLHEVCMEMVVRVLNAGRTLAALGGGTPTLTADSAPAVYAMRSEQLDTRTCPPCRRLHGTIVEVGTPAYFALVPPIRCVTASIPGIGARCRGLMVYGDSPADFREAPGQILLSA